MPDVAATASSRPSLTRFAWLSIGAALTTMAMKAAAAALTGSPCERWPRRPTTTSPTDGRRRSTCRPITLEAGGKHLMTDVWRSAGVLVGIGFVLINRSVRGLLDASLPPDRVAAIEVVLDRYRSAEVEFHALRTRQAGRRAFLRW